MFKSNLKRYTALLSMLIVLSFVIIGCSDDSTTEPSVDESALLLEFLEGPDGGDYINTKGWSMKTAEEVKTGITGEPTAWYLIDIRADSAFQRGHIQGAINVPTKDLLTHYQSNNLSAKTNVVIVCYSGQTAAYCASLMQIYGLSNVYSMKFGMSAWHSDFNTWKSKVSNAYYSQWNTTNEPYPADMAMPLINTGKTTGREIMQARVNAVLQEGFANVSAATYYGDAANYYVMAYWSNSDYLKGHVAGAVDYISKSSLKSTVNLKSIPSNKKIAIYCYTGHTAAFAAAYLKVLGYDAKSMLYGGNGMAYDFMVQNKMSAYKDTECKEYDYVK